MSRFLAGSAVALLLVFVAVAIVLSRNNTREPTPLPTESAPPTNGSTIASGSIVFDSNRYGGHHEIYSMTSSGSSVRRLTTTSDYDSWWPQVSPDRTKVLFYRTPAGTYDRDYTQTELWVMNADGSGATLLLPVGSYGWVFSGHAEWSPDGKQLVMFGGTRVNPQIFVTDASGRNPRQVTNRGGVNLDPNWSPDGSRIAFIGCPDSVCVQTDQEVYTISVNGGEATRITNDNLIDNDPIYSPDGKKLAWLTETQPESSNHAFGVWNIRSATITGASLRTITNDTNVNSRPEWSLDGTVVYFHRYIYGKSGWGIWSIKPDGSSLRSITAASGVDNGYPAP